MENEAPTVPTAWIERAPECPHCGSGSIIVEWQTAYGVLSLVVVDEFAQVVHTVWAAVEPQLPDEALGEVERFICESCDAVETDPAAFVPYRLRELLGAERVTDPLPGMEHLATYPAPPELPATEPG